MKKYFLLLLIFLLAGCAASDQTVCRVTAEKGLIVRSQPETSAARLGVLPQGDEVVVDSIAGEWAAIAYGSTTGYVAASYLEPLQQAARLSETSVADVLIFIGCVLLALFTGLLLYLHIRADERMNEAISGVWLLCAGIVNFAPMLLYSRFNESFSALIDPHVAGWIAAVICMLFLLAVWIVPCMTVWKLIGGVFSSDQTILVRVLALPLALLNLIVCILFLMMSIRMMIDVGLYMLLVYLIALPLLGLISAMAGGDVLSAKTVKGTDGHTYRQVVHRGRNASRGADYTVKDDRSGSVYKRTK